MEEVKPYGPFGFEHCKNCSKSITSNIWGFRKVFCEIQAKIDVVNMKYPPEWITDDGLTTCPSFIHNGKDISISKNEAEDIREYLNAQP